MIGLERNGDIVKMASFVPLLAQKNFTQWKTDLIFFDNSSICLTPNYFVQKLFSLNRGELYINNIISNSHLDSALAASAVHDPKSVELILNFVNTGNTSGSFKINLSYLKSIESLGRVLLLTGDANDENTLEQPNRVAPMYSTKLINKLFDYAAPPMSLSIIRLKITM